ncbi:MAG: hypothetical protein LBV67_07595, partial [Streptococcaceae bacterium]|nr:hypothetical protein [Streptococcaceae bacterium]
MKNLKKSRTPTILSLLILFLPLVISLFSPNIHVNAQEVGNVTVDENWAQNTTVSQNGNTGQSFLAPIYADGELVFCIDPWTPVNKGGG